MQAQQLNTALSEARGYFQGRGIKNYMVVLTAIDPCLGAYESRLRNLWTAQKAVTPKDEEIVRRIIRVVEVLKGNAGVGC